VGINLKKWLPVAGSIAFRLLSHTDAIEAIAAAIPELKGPRKRDAAVSLGLEGVALAESLAQKDLLNDPEVAKAAGAFVDAYVALQNVVAKKAPAE
jgi:hypothetical protein